MGAPLVRPSRLHVADCPSNHSLFVPLRLSSTFVCRFINGEGYTRYCDRLTRLFGWRKEGGRGDGPYAAWSKPYGMA
jgi:hypothetical protein